MTYWYGHHGRDTEWVNMMMTFPTWRWVESIGRMTQMLFEAKIECGTDLSTLGDFFRQHTPLFSSFDEKAELALSMRRPGSSVINSGSDDEMDEPDL
jgi:hypothetical protein